MKSCEGTIAEIAQRSPELTLRVDNMSAMQLLNGSTGSWRTRHLRLRSSWLKEQVSQGLMKVVHEPGESQLADIGTKPLPKARLQELVALWNLKDPDRKVAALSVEAVPSTSQPSSVSGFSVIGTKLALLAQCLCGVAESANIEDVKEPLGIESSIELYILILMGAVCAVAFWELARSCVRAGSSAVRLRAISSSSKASKPKATPKSQARTLTKAECRELSSLCDRDPSVPLPPEEAERFAALLAKLNNAGEQAPAQQQAPASLSEAPAREASSSPRPIPGGQGPMPPQTQRPTCVDASMQTEPTFLRLTPDPGPPMPARIEIRQVPYDGPFFCTRDGRNTVHTDPNCWGLRSVADVQQRAMCANCLQRLRADLA